MEFSDYEVVPWLAAEEVVTIDSDHSNQSSDIFSHSVHAGEGNNSEPARTDDEESRDDIDGNSAVSIDPDTFDVIENSSMSELNVESSQSSDDSFLITSDSDSAHMIQTTSSDSVYSTNQHPTEEHHNVDVRQSTDSINTAELSLLASASANTTDAETTLVHGNQDNVQPINLNSSLDCFVKPKKTTVEPVKSPVKIVSVAEAGEDGESCPICFEPWTNSGLHRLASLRCGHLFGQSCIEKWLKGQIGKCPQCNAKAHRKDVRVLFARSLKTTDTTERDRALEELEKEKEARRYAELEAAKARMHHQMAINECHQLRQELERQRQQVNMLKKSSSNSSQQTGSQQSSSQSLTNGSYVFEKHIRIHETGGCRVLAYCNQVATLCISQQSSNTLFPGFGVKKVSAIDFKTSEFVWVHSKAIRDFAINPRTSDATLLSCSIDKSIRLTSLHSNKIMQTYDCQSAVWSCVWDADEKSYFYAGLQNGSVIQFDVRNLSEPVQQLNQDTSSRSPVVSLQYMPKSVGNSPRSGGLLVGQLDHSTFHEKRSASGDFRVHLLPLEANLTSLSLEESTSHVLASYRPGTRCSSVRHQVCELAVLSTISDDAVNTDCTCRSVHTFYSGATQKLLSRSRLIFPPTNELMACAGDEATLSVYVWNAGTGQLQQKMPTNDPVIDICSVAINGQHFMAALTEKLVNVYQWK